MIEIKFLVKDPTGKIVRITYKNKPLIFGRQGTGYDLQDDQCSRRHCMISLDKLELTLEDLSSKNGTYINGVRTTGCRIFIGDTITIGNSEISVDQNSLDAEWMKKLTYSGDPTRRILGNVTLQLDNEAVSKSTTSDTDVRNEQQKKLLKK